MVNDLIDNRADILENDYCVYSGSAATGLFYYIPLLPVPSEGWDNEQSPIALLNQIGEPGVAGGWQRAFQTMSNYPASILADWNTWGAFAFRPGNATTTLGLEFQSRNFTGVSSPTLGTMELSVDDSTTEGRLNLLTLDASSSDNRIDVEGDVVFDAHGDTNLRIGTRRPPFWISSADYTTTDADEENVIKFDGSIARTLTVATASVINRWIVILNATGLPMDIEEGTGLTLSAYTAGGAPLTGDRTLAAGGAMTVYWDSTSTAIVYGTGVG
jgi:hypothetical protein